MNQDEMLDDLAERIQQMQVKARDKARKKIPSTPLKRGFHAKGIGFRATFKVNSNIPQPFQVDFFKPNMEYDSLVRFSNARGEVLGDLAKDQRGIAVRVKTIPRTALTWNDFTDSQDFLMTNTPVSFARNPVQFIEVGEMLLDGTAMVPFRLIQKYGFEEARRILGVFLAPILSFKPLQMNQYWSRTSYKFGNTSIRYLLRPSAGSKTISSIEQIFNALRSLFTGTPAKENYMRETLLASLKEQDLCFDFCIQPYVDALHTPIEDAYIEWKEFNSPPIPIATLTIPRQEFDLRLQTDIERVAFNPWNTREITPLGLINLARKKVYDASATNRGTPVKE
ncbi:MAG: catalase [Anaerolineales bacterium]